VWTPPRAKTTASGTRQRRGLVGLARFDPECLRAAKGDVGVEGQRLVTDQTQAGKAVRERLQRKPRFELAER
jgi:hypothetical protein